MKQVLLRRWPLGVLAVLHAFPVHAGNHEPVAGRSLQFHSALDGYRSFADQAVEPWVDTNEVVRKIGGWRAYAAERTAPDVATPSVTGQTTAPDSPGAKVPSKDPHASHGMNN